jgi:hypothetical protein
MDQDEKPLERAWLHVIKCEAQLTTQVLHIGRLANLSKDVTKEEAVLADFENELRLLRAKLALEQAEAARRRRHAFASLSTGDANGSAQGDAAGEGPAPCC